MAYERVNWENLPSTNTPVNADNLNKLNDAIDQAGAEIFVGTEEPVAGEKVWFNKNKNSIYVRNSNGVYEEYKEQVTAINKINLNSKFSFASVYPSINPIVEKINNIVHISAIIKYNGTLPTSEINVGNLPLEYRPNTQQVFMCGVGETQYAGWNINRAGYLAIHSNGSIMFRTDSTNVSYIFINITYFTD